MIRRRPPRSSSASPAVTRRRSPVRTAATTGRYYRPVYSVAYKMLRSERECEEVVQDVLVTLWQKGSSIRDWPHVNPGRF